MIIRPVPAALIEIVQHFEGLHDGDPRTTILEPKRDPVGLWTIGWGHLVSRDPKISAPAPITKEQAVDLLRNDLIKAAATVSVHVHDIKNITDGQYMALCDFVFNVGAANFAASTLLKKVIAGDDKGAELEFGKWIYATQKGIFGVSRKKKLPGLIKRRACEAALYAGGNYKEHMI